MVDTGMVDTGMVDTEMVEIKKEADEYWVTVVNVSK